MELKDLVGRHIMSGIETGQTTVKFYRWREDVCNYVKFTLDGVTYMAVEDPDDGYRSYLSELEIVPGVCKVPLPDIRVDCHMIEHQRAYGWDNETDDVLGFVDAANGKEFLQLGTGNIGDYYPYCVMDYHPENLSCNNQQKM